ncbi:MAG: hypothetical protein ACRD1R_07635 [Acidobacteriota bacterium]
MNSSKLVLVLLVLIFASNVAAQDRTVLLENGKVRVVQVLLDPGVVYPPHTHDLPHVGVIIKGGTLEFHEGETVEKVTFEDGDTGWREAGVTHSITNTSPHSVHIVEVELK